MSDLIPDKQFDPGKMFEEEFEIVKVGDKPAYKGPHILFQFAIVVLVATAAFFIGRLAFLHAQKPPITIEEGVDLSVKAESKIGGKIEIPAAQNTVVKTSVPASVQAATPSKLPYSNTPIPGGYVASKSGTKYYTPTCGTVSRIKEENKIWFATKADAEAAGYEPSSTCKGL